MDNSRIRAAPGKPEAGERYRHFKGGVYEVLHVGRWEPTEEPMVVYRDLAGGGVWGRPLAAWVEEVAPGVPRFRREEEPRP